MGTHSILGWVRRERPPLEPHEFVIAMHMLSQPSTGAFNPVPHVVTPTPASRCAREDCGRPPTDPIHRLPDA